MTLSPTPSWPVVVLAAISAVDGLLCVKPVQFVSQCLTRVGFPRRYWPLLSPIKFGAAIGLVAGLRVPILGIVTTGCVVLYFLIAIAMHLRARDLTRNLFVNASGMLAISAGTLGYCFLL